MRSSPEKFSSSRDEKEKKLSRRDFLKRSALGAAGLADGIGVAKHVKEKMSETVKVRVETLHAEGKILDVKHRKGDDGIKPLIPGADLIPIQLPSAYIFSGSPPTDEKF